MKKTTDLTRAHRERNSASLAVYRCCDILFDQLRMISTREPKASAWRFYKTAERLVPLWFKFKLAQRRYMTLLDRNK